jgi:outer membrane receptor protein involved in Fe transport
MPTSTRFFAGTISLALAIAGATVGGTFTPSNVYAQDDEDMSIMEEVMVTASRREESLQDVALAMSVLDTQEFAEAGLTNLTSILTFVPGVIPQDGGATFGNNVFIRGINAAGAAGVGTYVDDIPYGSSTVYAGGGAPVDGTLLDLESLNVLKGPQGTLYGASAMGGMLKYKTRNPSLDHWSGNISADLSSTKGGGLNQLYRVTANGPLSEDTVGLSVTGFWQDKTGYIDNVVIPREHWDDYEYYGGSAALLFVPTDKMTVKAQVLYQKSTQDGVATVQGDNDGNPIYSPYETGETDVNPSIFETKLFGLTIEYDFDAVVLTSVTSYQELEFSQSADLTVPFAFFADIFFPENAPHTSAIFTGTLGWDKFTQEVRLTSESSGKFQWLIGGFYSKEEGFNEQILDVTPPEPLFFYANFPSVYEEKAVFGTATYYFTPDFDANFGIRHADNTNSVELLTRDSILVAPVPFNEVNEKVTTYLFNMRYRPRDNMSIYARAASGYRPGGANFVLLDPVTGLPITDPRFDADELWSYELGFKGQSANGRVAYDAAVFYIDWRDYQIGVTRGGLNVLGNAEKASSMGAEASLNFAVTESFILKFTGSYIDAQLEADEPDLGGAKGTQLPSSPKWSGTISFQYDFNMGSVPAYLGGSWTYSDKKPVGFDGYTDSNGVFWPSSAPRYIIPSYDTLNLHAGISTERFDASVYVNNLLDSDSWTNYATNFSGFATGIPQRPQTFGVVLRAKF